MLERDGLKVSCCGPMILSNLATKQIFPPAEPYPKDIKEQLIKFASRQNKVLCPLGMYIHSYANSLSGLQFPVLNGPRSSQFM